VKYTSAIASTGSGSMGGATASRNKGGQYFRRRAIPTNPASTYQVAVRNAVSQFSNAWSNTLTQANRDAWNLYATNVNWTDTLGQSIKLSGNQMYIRSNTPRQQAGLTAVSAGPTNFTLAALTLPTITGVAATGIATVTFTNTDVWATAVGGSLLIRFSRPQSAGINFFKGPYRYAFRINGAATPPTSPATGSMPFTGAAGNRVFWSVRATNADGRLSAELRGNFLLT
jgi:hypothetical protein